MKIAIAVALTVLAFACGTPVVAQPAAAVAASAPTVISEVGSYGTAIGAVITAMAALFGLPIVFLTYKKTRAEIDKLELEANALRQKQGSEGSQSGNQEGNIRINVERSQDVTIQVLADPRFLAPLLLLVDFIFAWVVLTLADRLMAIFAVGFIRNGALALLAATLLLPIAKQVLRVRAVLSPPKTPEELKVALRQTRVAVYVSYLLLVVSAFSFAILLLTVSPSNLTDLGRYLAWALLTFGSLLLAAAPFLRRRFNQYLESAYRAEHEDEA
ncbi:MAG: hypothetical protein NTZ15_00455 [Burkholderiales bacterium]|nr:hypothetical protein [Burkholderiales bacterium]